ncbi:SLP adapter and CSK-interacting membrane protein [Perognathus longimembris pacificus]|uniref:SLP adapter and CSK-interacting membrane protein n=1 Tax=Perognathus longimembris pacificus TaxID=214514 RepID=UPI0020185206|nr:SLP adapter and CSK-interacting membrane protein [Perognathus longimembris pacificus]
MTWWKDYFWIILAVAIIAVSLILGLILFFVCRWQLRQGKKWDIAKPLSQNQGDEEKMYENVLNQSPGLRPPLPPRGSLSPGDSTPQDSSSQSPAKYTSVKKFRNKKIFSFPGDTEPQDDYDDVEIPPNTGNHDLTTITTSWQDEECSHNAF